MAEVVPPQLGVGCSINPTENECFPIDNAQFNHNLVTL